MLRFFVPLLGSSVLAVLLLIGCFAEPPPGSEPCEAQRGYLAVCATYFGDVAEGSVLIRVGPDDDLVEAHCSDPEFLTQTTCEEGHCSHDAFLNEPSCVGAGHEWTAGATWYDDLPIESYDDLPIESLFGADGCTVVELQPGSYEWSAQHLTDSCVTAYVEATIGQCEEVTEVSTELGDWCVDGR
jgi:hypothetical protein